MKHYVHPIALDDIAAEVGRNRSAFWLLLQAVQGDDLFAVRYAISAEYGLGELLKHSQKNVSEICCMVGFSDLPHFVRVFTRTMGRVALQIQEAIPGRSECLQIIFPLRRENIYHLAAFHDLERMRRAAPVWHSCRPAWSSTSICLSGSSAFKRYSPDMT